MSQATKDDLNHAILFNLKEDGNIPVNTIDKKSLAILDKYLSAEISSGVESNKNNDLQKVHRRISEVLHNN